MLVSDPAAGGDWIRNAALENCCEGHLFGGLVPPNKEGFCPCPPSVVNLVLEQADLNEKYE
jgi:hypothetical protein